MIDFGLSENTTRILQDYFEKIDCIEMVKIYGSRAIGNYRKGSDIDFAIFGDVDSSLIGKITYEIDELPTPYMFDITCYNTIGNEKLKEHIDKYGKVFYSKNQVH